MANNTFAQNQQAFDRSKELRAKYPYNTTVPEQKIDSDDALADLLRRDPGAQAAITASQQQNSIEPWMAYKAAHNIKSGSGTVDWKTGTFNEADTLWKELAIGAALVGTAGIAAPAIIGALGAGAAAGGGAGAAGAIGSTASAALGGGAATGLGGAVGTGGFWSTLVSGGKKAMDWVGGAEKIGDMAAGAAGQMGANRTSENQDMLNRDALNLRGQEGFQSAQDARARTLMSLQEAESKARADEFRRALLGRLTSGTADVKIDRSGFAGPVSNISFGGGLKPSVLGDLAQRAGGFLETDAMRRLQTPEARPTLDPIVKPEIREAKKGGFWEGLLGAGGLVGAAAENGMFGTKKPGGQTQNAVDDVEAQIFGQRR